MCFFCLFVWVVWFGFYLCRLRGAIKLLLCLFPWLFDDWARKERARCPPREPRAGLARAAPAPRHRAAPPGPPSPPVPSSRPHWLLRQGHPGCTPPPPGLPRCSASKRSVRFGESPAEAVALAAAGGCAGHPGAPAPRELPAPLSAPGPVPTGAAVAPVALISRARAPPPEERGRPRGPAAQRGARAARAPRRRYWRAPGPAEPAACGRGRFGGAGTGLRRS